MNNKELKIEAMKKEIKKEWGGFDEKTFEKMSHKEIIKVYKKVMLMYKVNNELDEILEAIQKR